MIFRDFYLNGLERVVKVIDAIDNYDSIIGLDKLSKSEYFNIISLHNNGEINLAVSEVELIVKRSGFFRYDVGDSDIISYATTYNNNKQINFFKKNIFHFYPYDIVNISEVKGPRDGKIGSLFTKNMRESLIYFFKRKLSLKLSVIHQIIYYSVYFCLFIESLKEKTKIKALVLANDHSPIPVALSMVCGQLGIKRVYLQHAAVTSAFPSLDFDYSILMDERSKQVYKKIGNVKGKIYVLPRDEVESNFLDIYKSIILNKTNKIIIYPSSIFEEEAICTLVEHLNKNKYVDNIYIKLHPSSKNSSEFFSGVKILSNIPDFPHVAIVGNSSVALELIQKGNVVYSFFSMDNVRKDYYGFVKEGYVEELNINEIAERFWKDNICLNKIEKNFLREMYGKNSVFFSDKERSFLFKRILVEFGLVGSYKENKHGLLYYYMSFYPVSFFSNARSENFYFKDIDLILGLNHLFDSRYIDFGYLYKYVDCSICLSVVDFWFILKQVEWSAKGIKDSDLNDLCHFVYNYKRDRKAKRWLEVRLFDLLLRLEKVDLLSLFFKKVCFFDLLKQPINKKISYINFLKKVSGNNIYEYNYLNDSLTDFEILKIRVQCNLMDGFKRYYGDYLQVERSYLDFCSYLIKMEYNKYIIPTFCKIRDLDKDRFFDVKIKENQRDCLIAIICDSLLNKKPLSIVRLSDGEGYFFQKSAKSFFSKDDAKNRERHWWGEVLSEKRRDYVVQKGLEAIREADIIGIPSIYRFLRDTSVKSTSLMMTLQGRGLVSIVMNILNESSRNAVYGDDKLNLSVFNNINYINKLCSFAKNIIVVTGAGKKEVKQFFFKIGYDVLVLNIPTHNKTSSNERFFVSKKILPDEIDSINEKLKKVCSPGSLVIVGAGVAGKSFINTAKQAGAVGLDFGSAMDEMVEAGIHSLY